MSVAPIRVAFRGCVVEILADDPQVESTLRADHRYMTDMTTTAPRATLEIRREGDGYRCRGRNDTNVVEDLRPSAARAVRWARQRVLEAMVAAHPESLWLHGAAVGVHARAVLIVGPRGSGKSTLSTALCARGATFLSDDVLPIDPDGFTVHPFPRSPEVRQDPGEEMPPAWLLEVEKTAIAVDDRLERSALPVSALLFPRAGRTGGISLEACAPRDAVVALAGCTWNFAEQGARAAAAIGRLASAIPVARIAFDDGAGAAVAVESWLGQAR